MPIDQQRRYNVSAVMFAPCSALETLPLLIPESLESVGSVKPDFLREVRMLAPNDLSIRLWSLFMFLNCN